jgi:ribosomal protein L29
MLLLEITSAVTALTLVILASCLIPVLLELRKTAISLRTISESMQAEIKPLIKELRDTIADIQVVTSATADNADGVNLLLEELGQAGHNIRMINKVIGVASTVVASSSAWMTGARVAGKFIADRLIKKRR